MTTEADEVVERIESEEEDLDAGSPIYRIRSYPSDPDLEMLHGRWKRGDLIIPEFQRGFVWKPAQASRLIESFLMGLPVPGIFVFVEDHARGDDNARQLVIDGQQRLRSVFGFFEGELPPEGRPFKLTGVDDRWVDKDYADLTYGEQKTLLTSVLRVVNIEQRDPPNDASSIYKIFERLNTGGTTLTPQEIRNSSCHGPFNDMLVDANVDSAWREIFGSLRPDPRMRDVELIVRFLALYEASESYSKPMKEFITNYMARHQREAKPQSYRDLFIGTARNVFESLGSKPFHVRRGINVAVFDSVMVAFAKSQTTPSDICERYQSLVTNTDFTNATTAGTTDVDTVRERLELASQVLFE